MSDNLNFIRVLPENVVAQIAAGEVVERPASVVKELVENSIDAGARKIEIEVKEGGQKLIEVSDDGVGMSRQDAILAFSQHATSKISSIEDLQNLSTLGFRGEALASIASVSRIVLVTRREDIDIGTRISVEGGHIKSVENAAHPRGTRISVKNLFFNVPARRKFLRSPQAEMAQISDIVCHYILGYPEISFYFTRGNVPITTSQGTGSLFDAVISVYGSEISRELIPLKEIPSVKEMGVKIKGFISPPNRAKPSARYMTTLVNRRYVKSKLLSTAISRALADFYPRGKFPVLIFDMRIANDLVDVNVHPQKTEVRFSDERWIFGAVYETIRESLSGLSLSRTEATFASTNVTTSVYTATFDELQLPTSEKNDENIENVFFDIPQPSTQKIYHIKEREVSDEKSADRENILEPVVSLQSPKIVAQLMKTYILGEDKEGLFIIDQHAAHERVLFDQYQLTYQNEKINTQNLLFPTPLKLLPSERMVIKNHFAELEALGFRIIQEDDGQYYATGIPVIGNREADIETIHDLISRVVEGWQAKSFQETKTDLLKIMACRSAIKAGEQLQEPEMKSLLEQLLKTKNPYTCPHGRPVILRLPLSHIERSFLRV